MLYSRLPAELHDLADIMHDAAVEHFEEPPNYNVFFKVFDDGDYSLNIHQRLPTEEERYDVVWYSPDIKKVVYAERVGHHADGKQVDSEVVAAYEGPRKLFDGHTGGNVGRDP